MHWLTASYGYDAGATMMIDNQRTSHMPIVDRITIFKNVSRLLQAGSNWIWKEIFCFRRQRSTNSNICRIFFLENPQYIPYIIQNMYITPFPFLFNFPHIHRNRIHGFIHSFIEFGCGRRAYTHVCAEWAIVTVRYVTCVLLLLLLFNRLRLSVWKHVLLAFWFEFEKWSRCCFYERNGDSVRLDSTHINNKRTKLQNY